MLATYDKETGLLTLQVRLFTDTAKRTETGSGKQINVCTRIQGATAGDGPLSDPVCDPVTGWPINFNFSATIKNPEYVPTADSALSPRDKARLAEASRDAIPQPQPMGMVQLPNSISLADGTTLPAGALVPANIVAKLLTGMK